MCCSDVSLVDITDVKGTSCLRNSAVTPLPVFSEETCRNSAYCLTLLRASLIRLQTSQDVLRQYAGVANCRSSGLRFLAEPEQSVGFVDRFDPVLPRGRERVRGRRRVVQRSERVFKTKRCIECTSATWIAR